MHMYVSSGPGGLQKFSRDRGNLRKNEIRLWRARRRERQFSHQDLGESGAAYETGPTRTMEPVGAGTPPAGSMVTANALAVRPGAGRQNHLAISLRVGVKDADVHGLAFRGDQPQFVGVGRRAGSEGSRYRTAIPGPDCKTPCRGERGGRTRATTPPGPFAGRLARPALLEHEPPRPSVRDPWHRVACAWVQVRPALLESRSFWCTSHAAATSRTRQAAAHAQPHAGSRVRGVRVPSAPPRRWGPCARKDSRMRSRAPGGGSVEGRAQREQRHPASRRL